MRISTTVARILLIGLLLVSSAFCLFNKGNVIFNPPLFTVQNISQTDTLLLVDSEGDIWINTISILEDYSIPSTLSHSFIISADTDTSFVFNTDQAMLKGKIYTQLDSIPEDSISGNDLVIRNQAKEIVTLFEGTTGSLYTIGSLFPTSTTQSEYKSCMDILTAHPNAPSGVYTIDPDGIGPLVTINAYCEMTLAGGGWTLIINRKANTNNVEGCGTILNEFLQSPCGSASMIGPDTSYSIGKGHRQSIPKDQWLNVQYLNGALDSNDAFILHTGSDIFPDSVANKVYNVALDKICTIDNATCDDSDGIWLYTPDGWFSSSFCHNDFDNTHGDYYGNYGYCHNGLDASSSNGFTGDRVGYAETKLWANDNQSHESGAHQERFFVRNSYTPFRSCYDIKRQKPDSEDGVYTIDYDGAGPATSIEVYCDMTTDGGGWIDVIKTFASITDQVILNTYRDIFFSTGSNTTDLGPIVARDGWFHIRESFSKTHAQHQLPLFLNKNIRYTEVKTNWKKQGMEYGNCNNPTWIPLNGPGYNGGNPNYTVECPNGKTCIQGTASVYRDKGIQATYQGAGLTENTILAWSGGGWGDQLNSNSSCALHGDMSTLYPATEFTQLLLRDKSTSYFKTCNEILTAYPNSHSGVYTISPEGDIADTLQTYCDMETDGGGWMLYYANAADTNMTDKRSYESHITNKTGLDFSTYSYEDFDLTGMIDPNLFQSATEVMVKDIGNWKTTEFNSVAFETHTSMASFLNLTIVPSTDQTDCNDIPNNENFYVRNSNGVAYSFNQMAGWNIDSKGLGWGQCHPNWGNYNTSDVNQTNRNHMTHIADVENYPALFFYMTNKSGDFHRARGVGGFINNLKTTKARYFIREAKNYPTSCQDILNKYPLALDGIHKIDPDGVGGDAPIKVLCDMTTDGGGWTQVFNHKMVPDMNEEKDSLFASAIDTQNKNSHNPNANLYSILNTLKNFETNDNFTFRITWPSVNESNIWQQQSNPNTDVNVQGYVPISIIRDSLEWGGLELGNGTHVDDNAASYLDGATNISWWYYAIGTFSMWEVEGIRGFPAGQKTIPQTWVQLWVKGSYTPLPKSCAEILEEIPYIPSGKYLIDPDGVGLTKPFEVYCDMITYGGGWTQVARLNTNDATAQIHNQVTFWEATTQYGTLEGDNDFMSEAAITVPSFDSILFNYSFGTDQSFKASFTNTSNNASFIQNTSSELIAIKPNWLRSYTSNDTAAGFFGDSLKFNILTQSDNPDDFFRIWYNKVQTGICNQTGGIGTISDTNSINPIGFNWAFEMGYPTGLTDECQENLYRGKIGTNVTGTHPVIVDLASEQLITPSDMYDNGIMTIFVK